MSLEHRRFDNTNQIHEAGAQKPALEFKTDEFVVYPGHGVGRILSIEVQAVAGTSLEFFVIYFAKSKMTARVPTQKATSIGLRKLSSPAVIEQVRRTLGQPTPRARTNWIRLTKEYEAKIKSGDIIALAEVMRDLHRRATEIEQSYSERQFYGAALDRLSAEVALVEQTNEEKAVRELEGILMSRAGRTNRC
jgi:CarD family transcriptional regulator